MKLVQKKHAKDKYETRMAQFIVITLYLPAIKFCFFQSIPGMASLNTIANIFIGIVISILFARQFKIIFLRSLNYIILNLLIILLMFFSVFISKDYNVQNFFKALPDIILLSSFLFLTTVSIRNYTLLYECLLKYSPIVIISSLFMIICTSTIGVVGAAESTYNMSLSYYVLVPTMICFLDFLDIKKLSSFFYAIFGFLVVVFMGSRGPLLCMFVFLFIYILNNMKLTMKNLILFILLSTLFILFFINYQTIVENLYEWLLSKNIESRTLLKILSGKIFDDSNRSIIIANMLSVIEEYKFGIGFMGDLSCHNIFVENLLWFGLLFGFIINLVLVLVSISILFKKISLESKNSLLLLVFFSYAVPDAILNLTVWGKDMFWIFIAIFICGNIKSKLKIKT